MNRHSVRAARPARQHFDCQEPLTEANVLNVNNKKQKHSSATLLGWDVVKEPPHCANPGDCSDRQEHRLVEKRGRFGYI